MGHLSHGQLFRLARAAEGAGFGFPDRRRLLLDGLPPAFVALMPVHAVPRIQLLADLQRLNSAGELPDGTVPLQVWLDNASLLVDGDPAASAIIEARTWLPARGRPAAGPGESPSALKQIFVSHADAALDRAWAAWTVAVLEGVGLTVTAAVWDDMPGRDWTAVVGRALDEGGLMLALLSSAYPRSPRAAQEWRLAAGRDGDGDGSLRLVPVLIEPVRPPGIPGLRTEVNLCGLAEPAAKSALLAVVGGVRRPAGNAEAPSGVPFPRPSG
ncbi:toll/interleukin-1 receptor domain-containing protein [Frankia gtarii]|uniref:toll/interleukin-1 receptor domain-containing protein n=1 Tax=Frankia gtarii TaxID=2950102 RepID=UPI0021C0B6E6|nr:toll/interleukin-1 receptor domain-containing protein [Frankia gtarii]